MSKSASRDKWGQRSGELTSGQRASLEALFREDQEPSKSVRLSLSLQIGMSPQHIGRFGMNHTTLFKVPYIRLQSTIHPSSKYHTSLFKVPPTLFKLECRHSILEGLERTIQPSSKYYTSLFKVPYNPLQSTIHPLQIGMSPQHIGRFGTSRWKCVFLEWIGRPLLCI